ncbi:hypothetical protein JCM16303_001261 [Sporobolomyces ruberrimus]
MPNQAGINFNDGTYQGKDANNIYHGYRGLSMNPQSSPENVAHGQQMTSSFESAAQNTSAGYNGVVHNPQTSDAAKYSAAEKMGNMPNWGKK